MLVLPVPSPLRKSPPWHMKSLICSKTRLAFSFPDGDKKGRGKGDLQSGGIYSLCILVAVLNGSSFLRCKIVGNSLLSWERHLQRARTLCGPEVLLFSSI